MHRSITNNIKKARIQCHRTCTWLHSTVSGGQYCGNQNPKSPPAWQQKGSSKGLRFVADIILEFGNRARCIMKHIICASGTWFYHHHFCLFFLLELSVSLLSSYCSTRTDIGCSGEGKLLLLIAVLLLSGALPCIGNRIANDPFVGSGLTVIAITRTALFVLLQ